MKNLRYLLSIFLIAFIGLTTIKISAKGDTPSTMDLLRSTKWQVYKKDVPVSSFREYQEKIYTTSSHIPMPTDSNFIWTRECLYYLSDSIACFEYDKVGKNKNGKYLIFNDEHVAFCVYEIVKLDSMEMILRTPGEPPNITGRYKAVKR